MKHYNLDLTVAYDAESDEEAENLSRELYDAIVRAGFEDIEIGTVLEDRSA